MWKIVKFDSIIWINVFLGCLGSDLSDIYCTMNSFTLESQIFFINSITTKSVSLPLWCFDLLNTISASFVTWSCLKDPRYRELKGFENRYSNIEQTVTIPWKFSPFWFFDESGKNLTQASLMKPTKYHCTRTFRTAEIRLFPNISQENNFYLMKKVENSEWIWYEKKCIEETHNHQRFSTD